jgi:hypothetical protein
MKRLTFIILLMILFFSCNSRTKQNISHELTRIEVNPTLAITLKYSDIFCRMDVVQLKTDTAFLIDEVQKMVVNDSVYLIQCNNKLLVFDFKGNPKTKIENTGRGPGEYVAFGDFNVDGDQIEIYDSKLRKMISYDKKGTFINEWKCGIDAYSYTKINSDIYAFFIGAGGYYNNTNKKLLYYSKAKNKIVNSFIETPDNQISFMHFGDLVNFSQHNGAVSFLYSFNDTVYALNSEGIYPKYLIDFGKYRLPKSYLTKEYDDVGEFFESCIKTGYAFKLMGFFETDKIINSSFFFNGRNYLHMYYSKETGKAQIVDSYIDDLNMNGLKIKSSFNNLPKAANNKYYIFVDANEFKIRMDSLREILTFKEWKKYSEEHHVLVGIYSTIKIDDNPLLFVATLKDTLDILGGNRTF